MINGDHATNLSITLAFEAIDGSKLMLESIHFDSVCGYSIGVDRCRIEEKDLNNDMA